MSVSVWQQRPNGANQYECDVTVIGAGIVGAYTAYTLAEAGKRVALVETRFPAAGATGRNAGMSLMGAADNYATGIERYGRDKARELWHLTALNQRKTREFVERWGVERIPGGSYILAIDETESALLTQAYDLMRQDGFEVGFSPTDPLGRGFGAAITQPNDFGLDPVALVRALIENAPGDRLRLFAPAEVFAIEEASGGRLRVKARTVDIICEQVTLCTNAYSPIVTPYFQAKVRPVRAQMLMTAPLSYRVMDRLAYANYGYEYFRQLPDGSFLLGGGRSYHRDLEVGYDEVATTWLQTTLEEFLGRYFPDVAEAAPIVRRWAGTMGFTPDGLPIAGKLPVVPGAFAPISQPFAPAPATPPPFQTDSSRQTGIYFAVGFNGHGLGWGIVTADAMIGLMLGQQTDAGLFDVSRLD